MNGNNKKEDAIEKSKVLTNLSELNIFYVGTKDEGHHQELS